MWEIREGADYPKYDSRKSSSMRGYRSEADEAYDCGYEDGYRDAMKEAKRHYGEKASYKREEER